MYNMIMRRRGREIIHPQLREGFEMLYDELRAEGLSDEDAHKRLMTDFDWGLRNFERLRKMALSPRKDEFAETESLRDKEAENGEDLAAQWLEAYNRGDGSHLMLELMMGLRSTGS